MATDSPRSRGRSPRSLADSSPRGTFRPDGPQVLAPAQEPLAALSTRIPGSLLKRAKLSAIEHEEDLQDLIARALQRELDDPSG
jgi:hypothetical protein